MFSFFVLVVIECLIFLPCWGHDHTQKHTHTHTYAHVRLHVHTHPRAHWQACTATHQRLALVTFNACKVELRWLLYILSCINMSPMHARSTIVSSISWCRMLCVCKRVLPVLSCDPHMRVRCIQSVTIEGWSWDAGAKSLAFAPPELSRCLVETMLAQWPSTVGWLPGRPTLVLSPGSDETDKFNASSVLEILRA